jgi:predicted RNase H-like nuclease
MPQLSSTDRLLMAANDVTNALKHPHPEVTFSNVGYDTITALIQPAEILKKQVSKTKVARADSCPYQDSRKHKTCRSNATSFDFSHAA